MAELTALLVAICPVLRSGPGGKAVTLTCWSWSSARHAATSVG